MARVTQAEVEVLLPTDIADITAFIETANITVTDLLTGKGLSTTQLKEIERWLAAHFLAMREEGGGVLEHQVGSTRARFAELGKNLAMTRFGQQAVLLDTSGTLARAGGKSARFSLVTDK